MLLLFNKQEMRTIIYFLFRNDNEFETRNICKFCVFISEMDVYRVGNYISFHSRDIRYY